MLLFLQHQEKQKDIREKKAMCDDDVDGNKNVTVEIVKENTKGTFSPYTLL